MKGLVFSEFLDFVEQSFSLEVVDNIINKSHLESKGAYTSVGTYDHHEMMRLVASLSEETKVPVPELLKIYGKHLFFQFKKKFPKMFKEDSNTFGFLLSIENHIHVEVHKLYKDAELPHFQYAQPDPNTLILTYISKRPLADLAEGLIQGCIEYHKENIEVQREDLNQGTHTRFTLIKT